MVSEILLALGAIALTILALYFFYSVAHRAFRAVGFSQGEATLILLGSLLGSAIDIPLFPYGEWFLFINVGGAIIPIIVTFMLLRRAPSMIDEALVGILFTSIATYLVAFPTEEGIVSPFPLWLVPALVAAGVSLLAFWQEKGYAAPLAYVSGTWGAILGGDALHLPAFLSQSPPAESTGFASIGGAAVFDMIYLTGILAVTLDALLFHLRRREQQQQQLPYREPVVFTPSTPPEVLANYDPSKDVVIFPRERPRPGAAPTARPGVAQPTRPPPQQRQGPHSIFAPPKQ